MGRRRAICIFTTALIVSLVFVISQRIDIPVIKSERSTRLPAIAILEPPSELAIALERCATLCHTQRTLNDAEEEPVTSRHHLLAAAIGSELEYQSAYPETWPFALRQTDQFALQRILASRFRAIAESPLDFNEADYVFVDLDTLHLARCTASCPNRETAAQGLDRGALNRDIVRWLSAIVKDHGTRRLYPSLLMSLSLIDHDYEGSILSERAQVSFSNNITFIGIERQPWNTRDTLARTFLQMPYPSTLHLRTAKLSIGSWQSRQSRPYLVSFAGKYEPTSSNSGKGPHNGFAVRRALWATLRASNDTRSDVAIHAFTPRSGKSDIAIAHKQMASSIFCLQPPGDSPTRKGFFDSLLLGCIPVIFRSETYSKVFPHLGSVEKLAVILDEKEVVAGLDVVQVLSKVPRNTVTAKQKAIARLATRFQYKLDSANVDRSAPDAFDTLLEQLAWRATRDVW